MNKYMKGTLWIGLSVCLTAGLAACNRSASAEGPQYADVISATPITKTINNPTQQCHNEAVTTHKPVKDKHEILGTVVGAVAGGVLGHQVGGGKGKKLATVAGAAAGGYAGNRIQKHHQENATETTNKQVCKTVNHHTTKTVGYKVKYKYDGSVHTTRMDHDPGKRVEVKNGVTAVSAD